MHKLVITFVLLFKLQHVCTKDIRSDPDLWTFNPEVNEKLGEKIRGEASIISLLRVGGIEDPPTRERILFSFDIFSFEPQNFRVSVNYISKKLFLNLTTTSKSYSNEVDLKTSATIKSLFLRWGDEDDTIFVIVNCEVTASVVTPINLSRFFRSVSMNKLKILFNKRYELNVFGEDDDMAGKLQNECDFLKLTPEGQMQIDLMLDQLAASLIKSTPNFISILDKYVNKSAIANEIFIRSLFSKDVIHQTSNLYSLVHLIQSLIKSFPSVFQSDLEILINKIFWTQGKEHHFVRKLEKKYYQDISIKDNLLNILFSNSPRTFMDSLRDTKDIGKQFRLVFANPKISINQVMKNKTDLKYTLLDILFKKELDEDQLNLLSPNYIISSMFAEHYLKDLNSHPQTLNNMHKKIVFNTDIKDYNAIGKFIRHIFIKESALSQARLYLESDLVIGMRVTYVLASGQALTQRHIYWIIKYLIMKKDIELPRDLEYPEHIITHTLNECYLSPTSSRNMFMYALENILIYEYTNIGSYLDLDHGTFIYNLYRDLILNDLNKLTSKLKEELETSKASKIHELIRSTIQAVVANVDEVKEIRRIAVEFVNNTLSYAKMNASFILKYEENYVALFKKLVGKASNASEQQELINLRIKALAAESLEEDSNLTVPKIRQLQEVLDKKSGRNKEFEDIVAQDLKDGVVFYKGTPLNESTIFQLDKNEDSSINSLRNSKLLELEVLDKWYSNLVNEFIHVTEEPVTKKNG